MRKDIKISAIINTYNEENNIEKCLENIKWADEVIVVDMGSNDNTVNLAKKFTNNIYQIRKETHVELGRNFSINKANGEWILILDADETLTIDAEDIIRKLVTNRRIDGYWFPRRHYISSNTYLKYGYFYPDYQLRLFRNNKKIFYTGEIHIPPVIDRRRTETNIEITINHNSSHSKYNSFLSFIKFFPYIKIEGDLLSNTNESIASLLKESFSGIFRHSYRSFIRLNGYKDGYNGLRAALLYAAYRSSIGYFAFIQRLRFQHGFPY